MAFSIRIQAGRAALAACALVALSTTSCGVAEPDSAALTSNPAGREAPAEESADDEAEAADATAKVARPEIVAREDWGSNPDAIPEERRHDPKYITIHHAGVEWKAGDDPYKKLVGLQSWGKSDKGWPDLPYHFLIAPDGRIFEGRPVEYEPETNTEYNVRDHIGVQLWGNFSAQRVSAEQLDSTVRLVAWLKQAYEVPNELVRGHGDVAETECPGRDFHRYIKDRVLHSWLDAYAAAGSVEIVPLPELPDGPSIEIPKGAAEANEAP